MKKVIAIVVILACATVAVVQAVSVISESGAFVAVPTEADQTAAIATRAPAAAVNTNHVADVTTVTPSGVGQILISTPSNIVWVAKGATTNDWIQIKAADE